MNIEELVNSQRAFFLTQKTKDLRFRKQALLRLKQALMTYEDALCEALSADLHKAKSESYMSEIGMVLSELRYQLSHMDRWAKPKRVATPLAQFYATSFTMAEPYGVTLIMAPWNYPVQLCLEPAIGAIAAGNTVIIKPSAYAPATAHVLQQMISSCFPEQYVALIEGGRKENAALLEQRFDHIFFTGGVQVGKLVMEKASRYLTPVTLELGGKSPCIVAKDANLKLAAKRIAFGKLLNAGQTCVAPDYIYIDKAVKNDFLCYMQQAIQEFLKDAPIQNPEYPKIINEKHFQRLHALIQESNVCFGGAICKQTLQIEPTLLDPVQTTDKIMQEEIFGPILPILTYDTIEEVIAYIQQQEHPLALYLFTKNKKLEAKVLQECSFGGGCINDTIIHLATSHMGFGGVGNSGMGSYHGYASFQTFSHQKSIVKKGCWLDMPFRYHPYSKQKDRMIRMFMK